MGSLSHHNSLGSRNFCCVKQINFYLFKWLFLLAYCCSQYNPKRHNSGKLWAYFCYSKGVREKEGEEREKERMTLN